MHQRTQSGVQLIKASSSSFARAHTHTRTHTTILNTTMHRDMTLAGRLMDPWKSIVVRALHERLVSERRQLAKHAEKKNLLRRAQWLLRTGASHSCERKPKQKMIDFNFRLTSDYSKHFPTRQTGGAKDIGCHSKLSMYSGQAKHKRKSFPRRNTIQCDGECVPVQAVNSAFHLSRRCSLFKLQISRVHHSSGGRKKNTP